MTQELEQDIVTLAARLVQVDVNRVARLCEQMGMSSTSCRMWIGQLCLIANGLTQYDGRMRAATFDLLKQAVEEVENQPDPGQLPWAGDSRVHAIDNRQASKASRTRRRLGVFLELDKHGKLVRPQPHHEFVALVDYNTGHYAILKIDWIEGEVLGSDLLSMATGISVAVHRPHIADGRLSPEQWCRYFGEDNPPPEVAQLELVEASE